jgi:hypothetical protein
VHTKYPTQAFKIKKPYIRLKNKKKDVFINKNTSNISFQKTFPVNMVIKKTLTIKHNNAYLYPNLTLIKKSEEILPTFLRNLF